MKKKKTPQSHRHSARPLLKLLPWPSRQGVMLVMEEEKVAGVSGRALGDQRKLIDES
jgi:hypothetical protein